MTVSAVAIGLAVPATAQAVPERTAPLLHSIHHYVHRQHKWAFWSYTPQARYHYRAERTHSLEFRAWIRDEWKRRAQAAYATFLRLSALTPDWYCIHTHEGAWNANTGNGYYGGLQMDIPFQTAYNPRALARYGTANNWPVSAQVIAARRAAQARGYTPWPNTARMCGLLS